MRKLWKLVMLGIGALALSGCFSGSLELQAVIHTDPNPPTGPYPLTVKFTGEASLGEVTECTWTFFRLENGEEISLGSAIPGSVVEYTFRERGKYRVYLTVYTADQRFAQNFVDVDVRSLTPKARFTADPYPEIQAGKTVTFDAQNSFDPDGTIVSYLWNFGDGSWTETTEPQVTHKYDTPGEYWSQLVVIDDYGDHSEPAILRLKVVPKGCGSCP
jgi:PKD repeat protein